MKKGGRRFGNPVSATLALILRFRIQEEAKKAQEMREQKARDLLERQPIMEPLDFDWEKEKDKKDVQEKLYVTFLT